MWPTGERRLHFLVNTGTVLKSIYEMVSFAHSCDLLDDETSTFEHTPKL